MLWKKPAGMKYTDMCIYVDANLEKISEAGKYPEIEDTVYNYLWLLVKALAIKKCMFQNFQDYDPFAFHAATRLFFAFRKSYVNAGKKIKGKTIVPIKSCLNYTKAILNPMKIEYQNTAFREIIDEQYVSEKFDAFSFKEQMRDSAKANQGVTEEFWFYLKDTFNKCAVLIDKILEKSPFSKTSPEYKKIKISLMLNAIQSIKQKKKFDMDPASVILWKLPKSMSSYVKILLNEFYTEIKKEIMDCYKAADIDEQTLDNIIASGFESEDNHEDEY